MRNFFNKERTLVLFADGILICVLFLLEKIVHLKNRVFPEECFYARKGILCPVCGGTKLVYALSKGRFVEAFFHNPYIFTVLVYGLILGVLLNLEFVFGLNGAKKIRKAVMHKAVLITLLAGYVVWALLRNFI